MPEPKRCQSCGESLGPSTKFCRACGAEQIEEATESSPTPAARYCSACGAGLHSDSSFCPECGERVEGVPTAPAPSAADAASRRSPQPTQPWYTQTWAAVVALLFFFPLGLLLLWRFTRGKVWITTVTTVVFLLFAVLIIVGAAVGGDEGDEDDDGGDIAGITESPTATDVGETPEPTVEIPIEEPTLPAVTAAECQYLNELGEQLIDVGEAFSNIGELSGRSDLLSDDWILEMAIQFVVIQLTEEAALAVDPPAITAMPSPSSKVFLPSCRTSRSRRRSSTRITWRAFAGRRTMSLSHRSR